MPTILVRRSAEPSGLLVRYRILIDGTEHGRIKRGAELSISVTAGKHEITALQSWWSSPPLVVELNESSNVTVEVRRNKEWWRPGDPVMHMFTRRNEALLVSEV
jgi:hypothetical protein